ncbi:FAD-binding oxidoreductase [Amycolatopsis balhimycina DSM 5908]|uniref:FAD-binding oxidoreductase n=1 Tax=Amycolatopsis balhimycina DSM 5908 TaxID=1081091 RepID=A0A428VYK2_AMYBA|nr:FAD-binding oxidoreductase [Amycolatopsis balhimycina]RSM35894.1 FAD-binding oxidoreductase [Amycolatopsis balhimycina DSM 5908]
MDATRTADVAVVGAGIVGLACAVELARAGTSVALVGPRTGDHAGQASRAAGAMLTVFSEVEAAHAPERVAMEVAERVAARAGYEAWLDQLAEITGGPAVSLVPGVWVTASVPADRAELAAIAAAAADAGLPGQLHPPDAVPGLQSESVFEALWLPGEAGVDAAALTAVAAAAAIAHPRITWYDTDAVTLAETGAAMQVRVATGDTVTTDQLVLAAGVQIPALLRRSRRIEMGAPPVLAGRGVSMVLDAAPVAVTAPVRTPNRGFACGAHLVARGDGQIYLGATNRLTTRPDPDRRASADEIATLLHDGIRELNAGLRNAQVRDIRVGYRPFTIDHLPLVGRTAHPNVLLATATYRCGMLLAPRVATLIRTEIDHPGALNSHPYSPSRPMPEPDLAQLVGEHSAALVELVCQPGGQLPAGAPAPLGTTLSTALAHQLADPSVRRLAASAPVPEVLPLLLDIIGRSTR